MKRSANTAEILAVLMEAIRVDNAMFELRWIVEVGKADVAHAEAIQECVHFCHIVKPRTEAGQLSISCDF